MPENLLSIKGLSLSIKGRSILSSLDFDVQRGRVLAIVGESGAGKTMTLRTVIGLLPESAEINSGLVMYSSEDLLSLSERDRESLRGREISMVSQNPLSSFNPFYRISHHFKLLCRKAGKDDGHVISTLSSLSLPDATRILSAYPDQLSGGMLQRLSLAASLLMNPHLLLLDEPTSALDLSVGNEIYSYLSEYRESHDITMLLVTHDLGRAAGFADDIVVMLNGRIVERSDVYEFFRGPMHPYSRMLLESALDFKSALKDDAATPIDNLCPFYLNCRCKMRICNELMPELEEIFPGHYVACFNAVDKVCK